MTTTVQIDDNLLAKAAQATGISDATILVRDGLAALAEQKSAKAAEGNSAPGNFGDSVKASDAPTPKRKPKRPLIGRYKGEITIYGDLDEESVWPVSNAERGFLINEEQG